MANQKVAIATIASHAAGDHVRELMTSVQSGSDTNKATVYATVFNKLMTECAISPEEFERRIHEYVTHHYSQKDWRGITGNLVKEASNSNMGQKVFSRLIKAVFPA